MTAGRSPRSSKNRLPQPLQLVLRLAVMGIGLGVITGTALNLLAPLLAQGAIQTPKVEAANPSVPLGSQGLSSGSFEPRTELKALSAR